MRRLSRLFSLVLLAVWLPATQHCGLEAAGLLPSIGCDQGCAPGVPCEKDGCGSLETALYKTSTDFVKAPAPDLRACACFLCLVVIPPAVEEISPFTSVAREHPREWVPTWHFLRRDAPPSRAPASVCA